MSLNQISAREHLIAYIGLSHRGPPNQIGPVFDTLGEALSKSDLWRKTGAWAGIYGKDVDGSSLSYACCAYPLDAALPDGFERVVLAPSARTAIFIHRGPYQDLPKSWQWFSGEGLKSAGLTASGEPCAERYLNDPTNTAPEDLLTELSIPLVP